MHIMTIYLKNSICPTVHLELSNANTHVIYPVLVTKQDIQQIVNPKRDLNLYDACKSRDPIASPTAPSPTVR